MERSEWLKEKRRLTEERYDVLFAPTFDEAWGTVYPTHALSIHRFLGVIPSQALILDAACGTGKNWPMILAGVRMAFGIDQSQVMLSHALE
jgi:SAM-dependent methyltransferase